MSRPIACAGVRRLLGLVIASALVTGAACSHGAQVSRAPRSVEPAPASPRTAREPAPTDADPTQAPPVDDARKHLDTASATTLARDALLRLSSTSWPNASAPAADALYALSDLLESGAGCPGGTVAEHSREVRRQARRLAGAGETAPEVGQGGWIKTALLAAASALDALRPPSAQTAAWRQAARGAVEAIDDHAALAFSRAPIQGALRATVDAAIIVLSSPCTE